MLEVQEDVNRVLFASTPAAEDSSSKAAAYGKQAAKCRPSNGKQMAAANTDAMARRLRQEIVVGAGKEQASDIVDMLDCMRLC